MVEEKNKKNKKIIAKIVIGIVAFLAIFVFSTIFFTTKVVAVLTDMFLGPKVSIENIDFEKNKLVLHNVVVTGDDGEEMINSPKIDMEYSLKDFKINKLKSYGGTAKVIILNKDHDVNVVYEFDKSESKHYENLDDYDPGVDIPIDRIEFENMNLIYVDKSFSTPAEVHAHDVNGYVTFSKKDGVYAEATGVRNQDENIKFVFKNKEQPFYISLFGQNVKIDDNLGKYAVDFPGLHYTDGKGDINLVISYNGLYGDAKVSDANIRYEYFDENIKIPNALANFDCEKIIFEADVEALGQKNKIIGKHENDILDLPINLKEIDPQNLKKIKGLENADTSKVYPINLDIKLNTDKEGTFKGKVKLNTTDSSELYGIKFKDINLDIESKDDINKIILKDVDLKILENAKKLNAIYTTGKDKDKLDLSFKSNEKSDIVPNLDVYADINHGSKHEDMYIKSNFLDFQASYDKEENKLTLKDKNFKIIYDIKNKKMEDGKGTIKINAEEYQNSLKYSIKDNVFNIENLSIKNNKKELSSSNGYYDLNQNILKLNSKFDNLSINKELNNEDLKIFLKGDMNLFYKDKKLDISGDLTNSQIKYIGNLNNINGKFSFKHDGEKYIASSNLVASELMYKDYGLKDIKLNFDYKDDILKITSIGNEKIKINGELNSKNSDSSINIKVDNLTNKDLGVEQNFNIQDITGKISGNIENPVGIFKINKAYVDINENKKININGNAKYENKIFKIDKIFIDKNELTGTYNFESGKHNAKLTLKEDSIFSFVDNKTDYADYKLQGIVEENGTGGEINTKINADFISHADKKVDIPKIKILGNYNAKEFTDGILKLENISLRNEKEEEIISGKANIDLKNQKINGVINQVVSSKKIASYIVNDPKEISGEIAIKADIFGDFKDIRYNLNASSKNITVKNEKLENINASLDGNLSQLRLRDFNFDYLGSKFKANGTYNLKNKTYLANIKSDVINLGFLKVIDKNNIIDKIDGKGNFNLVLSSNGNSGYANANIFNLHSDKYKIKMEDFESKFKLMGNRVDITSLKGKINDGTAKISGYVDLPKFSQLGENSIYDITNYQLDVNLDDINYIYPDVVDVVIDSNMEVSKKRLVGNIDIQRGRIIDIPNEYKDFLTILKNFLFRSAVTVNKEKDVKQDEDKERARILLQKLMPINLIISLREPVSINVDNLNVVVGEVNGKLTGNLNLRGSNGNYTLLGNAEILNGNVVVNNNDFRIQRGLFVFGDRNVFLPDLNPNVFVESTVNLSGEDVSFDINGKLDNLQFTMDSSEGRTTKSLNSLLVGQEDVEGTGPYKELLRNMAEGQVVQTVFGPITRAIKKMFNLSKFKITPNVDVSSIGGNIGKKENGRVDDVRLGTILEAETNLWKEKLFLNTKIKLFDLSKGIFNPESYTQSNIKDYDVNLEYRYGEGKSVGVGVGSIPDRYKTEEKEESDKKNYHIDFKVRKKGDNIFDLFNIFSE